MSVNIDMNLTFTNPDCEETRCNAELKVEAAEFENLREILHFMVEQAYQNFMDALDKKQENPELTHIKQEGSQDFGIIKPGDRPRITDDQFPR